MKSSEIVHIHCRQLSFLKKLLTKNSLLIKKTIFNVDKINLLLNLTAFKINFYAK
jgi:hypothetical protein